MAFIMHDTKLIYIQTNKPTHMMTMTEQMINQTNNQVTSGSRTHTTPQPTSTKGQNKTNAHGERSRRVQTNKQSD